MVSSQASASIAPTIEVKKQIEELSHKRYVLSVVSGQESIVIENLKERAKKNGLDEDIIDYLAPVTNETIMRRQKKVIKQRKLYPGYVFVKSRMNDKIWYVIRNTPGVRIIVGAETHPIPLSDAEYQNIVRQIEEKNLRSELVVPFQEGDVVIMRDGNFT
jgi:transcriptional antiterminator NusG